MTAGGPWGSSEVLAYKMYQESLFNYRMGYGAAIATREQLKQQRRSLTMATTAFNAAP